MHAQGAATADDQTGDVVVLRGVADEIVQPIHDAGQRGSGALWTAGLKNAEQAGLSKLIALFVASFGYAIGVDHQEIVGAQMSDAGFKLFGEVDAERNAFG